MGSRRKTFSGSSGISRLPAHSKRLFRQDSRIEGVLGGFDCGGEHVVVLGAHDGTHIRGIYHTDVRMSSPFFGFSLLTVTAGWAKIHHHEEYGQREYRGKRFVRVGHHVQLRAVADIKNLPSRSWDARRKVSLPHPLVIRYIKALVRRGTSICLRNLLP